MESLQYIIDSICTKLTVESIYKVIESRIRQGAFTIDEILPSIQSGDRSLDTGSAKMLAVAALEELVQLGDIRIEADNVIPLKDA